VERGRVRVHRTLRPRIGSCDVHRRHRCWAVGELLHDDDLAVGDPTSVVDLVEHVDTWPTIVRHHHDCSRVRRTGVW